LRKQDRFGRETRKGRVCHNDLSISQLKDAKWDF
jgi:hypothetical protein